MLESTVQAMGNFAHFHIWLWIMGGVIWGLMVGLIPGIGTISGMALFLPFVFKLQPMEVLPFLAALVAVAFTAGSITAILIGVPGETANVATIFDGYPMTQKGEGARAIGAALCSSVVGGVLASLFAFGMVFAVLPMVMSLTSQEMVFVILIGVAFISVLGKGSMLKGLISGGIGLLIASVGLSSVTGEPRFTFENPFLYDGIHLIPVALGLFAVPPMIELATKGGGGTIAEGQVVLTKRKDVWKGARDVFRHRWLALRSILIGYLFGVMPGVGASAAVFIAYGHAKHVSKHPERFGTGVVEGVIAPESCNNAKESGSLLTTLALGIPGSGTGAMFLGALIVLGFYPGPTMLTEHLDLSLTLILIIAVSNIIAAAICFYLAPQMALIAKTPGRILVPLVLVAIFIGGFTYKGLIQDVVVLLLFSGIGVASRRLGYNSAGLFLGYVLGEPLENYYFVSLQIGGPLFFMRPIPLLLIFALIAFFVYTPLKNVLKNRIRKGAQAL